MNGWEVKTILVGYDGSDGAERAIELAQEVAQIRKAAVIVLTAFPHSPRVMNVGDKVGRDIKQGP